MTHWSTCSSRSIAFSIASIYIHGSLPRPKWTRWLWRSYSPRSRWRPKSVHDKSTPSHLASEEGHVKVARVLAEHGADTTARDKDGSTWLHQALLNRYVDLA